MPYGIEVLPNTSGQSGQTGTSSWFYSTAPPSQSVSAMPTPDQLRGRKAKQKADAANHAQSLSKRDVAVQRRITELEKVNYRDVVIKIPEKGGAGGQQRRPKSQNVRRILASQKTFANYLADEEALAAAAAAAGGGSNMGGGNTASGSSSGNNTTATNTTNSTTTGTEKEPERSSIPLSYSKAVAPPPKTRARNARQFCEICGYWGKVRCMRCETRVCDGECLKVHLEARCTRSFI